MKKGLKGLAWMLAVLLTLFAPLAALAAYDVYSYQDLLDAAASAETVINILGNITYGDGGVAVKTAVFNRSVEIVGGTDAGGDGYTIAGDNTVRLIEVQGNLTISGLTLTDGNANGPIPMSQCGGALYVTGGAEINNCTFEDNNADYRGGAVYISGAADVFQSTFRDNNATDYGGAIFAAQGLNIDESLFAGNAARYGGAAASEGDLVIQTSSFIANHGETGGAVTVWGDLTILDSSFEGNVATVNGGAVFANKQNGVLLIDNSDFTGNEAELGGAILSFTDNAAVQNSTFTNNTASDSGGAIYAFRDMSVANSDFVGNNANVGGAMIVFGNTEISDSTFEGNLSNFAGGAINAQDGTTTTIFDSTFTGNETLNSNGGAVASLADVVIQGSTFEGNSASGNGGAVRANGSADIGGSTFENNSAGNDGGAVWISGQATATDNSGIKDTDFYGNTSGNVGGSIYSAEDLTVAGQNYFDGNGNSLGDPNGNAPVGREHLGIYMDNASQTGDGELIDGRRSAPEPDRAAQSGPVSAEGLLHARAGKIVNCKEWVFLRGDPSTDNAPWGTVSLGTLVTVVDYMGGFAKILLNDTVYYVHGDFVALV